MIKRKLKQMQLIVTMMTAIGFINLFAAIGHAYLASPTMAIVHGVLAGFTLFYSAVEAGNLQEIKNKHNL